ncbi:MAG: hypothetical protein ACR2NZ_09575 [Rubripirellula sp.]
MALKPCQLMEGEANAAYNEIEHRIPDGVSGSRPASAWAQRWDVVGDGAAIGIGL